MILGTHDFSLDFLAYLHPFLFKIAVWFHSSFIFCIGSSIKNNSDPLSDNWAICLVKKGIHF